MSEEMEGPDTGREAVAESVHPAAISLALGGASHGRADAFLAEQIALTRLQRDRLEAQDKHFHEEAELELNHLRWRAFTDRMKGALQIMTGLVGLAVALGLGAMVWSAAHSDGLVLEGFAVPQDFAANGNSSQVIASRLLDKIHAVQDASPNQTRPGRALSGGWGDDIKVEIPETGVSLGEAYRFLRGWLGHETHVSGEVVRTANGLAVSVRMDGHDGATFSGSEADLDGLVLKAAEHVEDVTDPARYGTYLTTAQNPPRAAEGNAVLEKAANDPSRSDESRATAFNNLSNLRAAYMADLRGAVSLLRQAIVLNSDYAIGHSNLANEELMLGHAEAALSEIPLALDSFRRNAALYYPDILISLPATREAERSQLLGDYPAMERQGRIVAAHGRTIRQEEGRRYVALALAGAHDAAAARQWLAQMPAPAFAQDIANRPATLLQVSAALQDWQAAMARAKAAANALRNTQSLHLDARSLTATGIDPWLALAQAESGDIAAAQATIAATPDDCYDCVRMRGVIASEAGQWARADYWFAKAVHDAPSIPLAQEDWGRSLLARGKADAAIGQFKLANAKGPHFADPLEGWGEALMAQNRSDLALAKFAEAEKYAPNWGRLHLKWGEALFFAGKKDEAKKQFTLAATLDLTAAEKKELLGATR